MRVCFGAVVPAHAHLIPGSARTRALSDGGMPRDPPPSPARPAGSAGVVDVDAFAAVGAPKPADATTANKAAGGADALDSFLDDLLTDGWSEERAALMDAAAAH